MARNTNINEILFPVECSPIFLESQRNPIKGFKAVTGKFDNSSELIFSIVSDNYQLISNKEAYEMRKEIHGRLFPNATSDSFEVFNVIAPKTASNVQHLQARNTNEMQAKCGRWLNLIDKKNSAPEFSWDVEVKEYQYLNDIKKLIF